MDLSCSQPWPSTVNQAERSIKGRRKQCGFPALSPHSEPKDWFPLPRACTASRGNDEWAQGRAADPPCGDSSSCTFSFAID